MPAATTLNHCASQKLFPTANMSPLLHNIVLFQEHEGGVEIQSPPGTPGILVGPLK